jgi:hypothetical protein
VIVALLGSLLASSNALAHVEPRVEFRWDAPEHDCPTEAEVLGRIEALLGAQVARARDERLTAIARVRRESDGRWDLRLWTVTEEATRFRSVHGETCSVVAEAGALIAAMAIDPDVLARASTDAAALQAAEDAEASAGEDEPLPEPEAEAEPEPLPEPETEPQEPEPASDAGAEVRRPRERSVTGAVRAAGGVTAGIVPGAAFGVELRGGAVFRRWRLDLAGSVVPPRRAVFDDRPGEGISTALVAGAVSLGPHWSWGPVELAVQVGLESGALLGRGFGLPQDRRGAVWWGAALLEPVLGWRFAERWGVTLGVTGVVPLVRSRFEVDGRGEVWRPFPVGVRANLGIEVRFP